MMANLVFEGGMARIQHGFAQCHDAIIRRSLVLDALNLRSGERVLEQGCGGGFYTYPIVAETYDGNLNDINGFHVKPADAEAALEAASTGAVAEGKIFRVFRVFHG